MRKLKTKDVIATAQIIKKANMRTEIEEFAARTKLFSKDNAEEQIQESGLALLWLVIEKIGDEHVGSMLSDMLADVIEISTAEFMDMDIETMSGSLADIAKNNNLSVFFKQAGLLR